MSALPVHTCADKYCPVFGQPTSKTCGCHKTSEQLLLAQLDACVLAMKAMLDMYGPPSSVADLCEYPPFHPITLTRAAINTCTGGR